MQNLTRVDPHQGGAGQTLVVLLAEDDENDVILIRRCLKRLKMQNRLITVPDGGEAIDYILGAGKYAERTVFPFPDVLLLDSVMPRVSGLDALCRLRAEPGFERLPVVLFSGGFAPAQREAVARLRAVCAVKAIEPSEMLPAIEQGIRSALALGPP